MPCTAHHRRRNRHCKVTRTPRGIPVSLFAPPPPAVCGFPLACSLAYPIAARPRLLGGEREPTREPNPLHSALRLGGGDIQASSSSRRVPGLGWWGDEDDNNARDLSKKGQGERRRRRRWMTTKEREREKERVGILLKCLRFFLAAQARCTSALGFASVCMCVCMGALSSSSAGNSIRICSMVLSCCSSRRVWMLTVRVRIRGGGRGEKKGINGDRNQLAGSASLSLSLSLSRLFVGWFCFFAFEEKRRGEQDCVMPFPTSNDSNKRQPNKSK